MRQGNQYEQVHIFRYVTKGTFDAYNWSIIENKQKFISQIMTNGDVARSCEDVDEAVLNYAEMKAIASGNPLIKQKMEIDAEISRLNLLKRSYITGHYEMEKNLNQVLPERLKRLKGTVDKIQADIEMRNTNSPYITTGQIKSTDAASFSMIVNGKEYKKRKDAGEMILHLTRTIPVYQDFIFGEYAGFRLSMEKEQGSYEEVRVKLKISGNTTYTLNASLDSDTGNVSRIQNVVHNLEKYLTEYEQRIADVESEMKTSRVELAKAFPKEKELRELFEKQRELSELLYLSDQTEEQQKDGPIEVEEAVRRKHISK